MGASWEEGAAPDLSDRLLVRPALLDRLDGILHHRLTVVSAPAGAGKSVAVGQWCAQRAPLPVTWLTGCTPEQITAMAGDVGESEPRLLVLDGATGAGLAAALVVLVGALGDSEVRAVVTTRQEVGGDLAAARLDGAVDLVVDRHLRFDAAAMVDLVRTVAGASIRHALAAAVVDELEGWPAGAMLLALDWDGACTVGNHRTVLAAGYRSCRSLLASLVLEGLDDATRALVLDGARLPELAGDLCDRIAAAEGAPSGGSEARLAALWSDGRFVVEVGADPPRYRFHRLARAALRDAAPRDAERDSARLREAAAWYGERGLPVLAAECFVERRDWDALAGLVFGNLFDLLTREQIADLVRLLTAIPAPVLRERWSWTYGVAYLLMSLGELASSLSLIATVEPGSAPAQMVVSEVLRANAATFLEDPTPSLEAAERALELCDALGDGATFPENLATSTTSQWRTQARAAALVAGSLLGDWERVAGLADHLDPSQALELPPAALVRVRSHRSLAFALAEDLLQADHEGAAVLDVAVDEQHRDEHLWAAAHLALGEVHRLRGDTARAGDQVAQGLERATTSGRSGLVALGAAIEARIRLDEGRPDLALRTVVDHQRAASHRAPPAIRDRLLAAELLARHRTGDALRARDLLDAESARTPLAAAIALVHLERGDVSAAERAVAAWPVDPTVGSVIRHRLASAAIAELRGQRSIATLHLAEALALAAPHGALQPFAELGIYVLRPLRTLTEDGTSEVRAHARAVSARIDQSSGALALLTPRERLVLGHLASPVSLPALADQLVVSTNTIKTQVKAIYRKLGVTSRDEAVAVWRAADEPAR